MSLQKKMFIFLFLFVLGQVSPVFSTETQKNIEEAYAQAYSQLVERDKKEVDKIYEENIGEEGEKLYFPHRKGTLSDKYNKHLLTCLKEENTSIREIKISRNLQTRIATSLVPILPRYKNLKILDISHNNITDQHLEKWRWGLDYPPALDTFHMNNNNITHEGMSCILQLIFVADISLSHLNLSTNKISEKQAISVISPPHIQDYSLAIQKLKYLDLSNQQISKHEKFTDDKEYEKEIINVKRKFRELVLILRRSDRHILSDRDIPTQPVLPINRLVVVSLSDTPLTTTSQPSQTKTSVPRSATSSTTSKVTHSATATTTSTIRSSVVADEERAGEFPNSPLKKTLPKNRWDHCRSIMAVDPSGKGVDSTGYVVIKVNKYKEYLITQAGGIEGDGLGKATFKDLLKVAEEQNVERMVIESNYHNGAFLPALKEYYERKYLQSENQRLSHENQQLLRENQRLLKMLKEGKKPEDCQETTKGKPEKPKIIFVSQETTGKDKGERIITTLTPILTKGKLFIGEEFFKKDWDRRHKEPSLFQQLSLVKPKMQSQNTENGEHDDIADALEIAIKFYKNKRKKDKEEKKLGVMVF